MQERYSLKQAQNEAEIIKVLQGGEPTRESYEVADFIVDIMHNIIPQATDMPEVQEAAKLDKSVAEKKIAAILMEKFPDELSIFKGHPHMVETIAGKVFLELITSYNTRVKRNYEGDFMIDDVVAEIAEHDGWEASGLKVSYIERDINDEVIAIVVEPKKPEVSIERFGKYVFYRLQYPVQSTKTGELSDENPIIERGMDDSDAEELDEHYFQLFSNIDAESAERIMASPEFDAKYAEHRQEEIFLEFEDGKWHSRTIF